MIDLEYLAQQTAGDAALQDELLDLFRTQLDALAADLTIAGGRPRDAVQAMLHRVRGAAVAIGANALAGSLGEAEEQMGKGALRGSALVALVRVVEATRNEATGLIAASKARSLAKAGESR